MIGFWTLIGIWGLSIAAAAYAALAILTLRRRHRVPAGGATVIALSATALWALSAAILASFGREGSLAGCLPETLRNAAWIAVVWMHLRAQGGTMPRAARPLFAALLLGMACQLPIDLALAGLGRPIPALRSLFDAAWVLRAAVALGAIFLLHGLFATGKDAAATERTGPVGWLAFALTILWAYDFHLYVLALVSDGTVQAVAQLRGLVVIATAPLMALGLMRGGRRFTLSRPAIYRVILIAAGVAYGFAMLAMLLLLRTIEDPGARIVQLGVIFALSVIALILLPSRAFRGWLRVEVAKHLFAHRYDYRTEWMRFAEALGGAGESGGDREGASPTLDRLARAVAEAVDAPAALLFLAEGEGALVPAAAWEWSGGIDAEPIVAGACAGFADGRWVIDPRAGQGRTQEAGAAGLPDWIAADPDAWAFVPLVHRGALVGAVLLGRPAGRGNLDWEDLDMLRVVACQLAAALAERAQAHAIAEAQRFDEFNRRFAFILHDIKNMVSQMSLLAANARRHADNPDFRADMILTLQETADRMNGLIARLARADAPRAGGGGICDVAAVVHAVARGRAEVRDPDVPLLVRGDAATLHQALGHLVQNAVDATAGDGPPVRITIDGAGGEVRIAVIDRGRGMSAEFLRSSLFRPFSSTKPAGFGLGAHEARMLVTAMGGTLSVESREGAGSRFTIALPRVVPAALDRAV